MKSSYTDSLAHTTFECKYHIVFAPHIHISKNGREGVFIIGIFVK